MLTRSYDSVAQCKEHRFPESIRLHGIRYTKLTQLSQPHCENRLSKDQCSAISRTMRLKPAISSASRDPHDMAAGWSLKVWMPKSGVNHSLTRPTARIFSLYPSISQQGRSCQSRNTLTSIACFRLCSKDARRRHVLQDRQDSPYQVLQCCDTSRHHAYGLSHRHTTIPLCQSESNNNATHALLQPRSLALWELDGAGSDRIQGLAKY